jgi:hypothetical protein
MKASGLMEMIDQQKLQAKIESEKQVKQMLDQIFSRIKPDEKFKKRLSSAAERYVNNLQSPWSSEEISAVWAKHYGSSFTDAELKALADFHESPLGQKDREASQRALPLFAEHFTKLGEPLIKKANAEFLDEIQLTIRECNCSK